MGLLSFLFGCGNSDESAYYKKDGKWFYAGVQINVETGPVNFKPLNKTFAKDDRTGYYRETPIGGSDGVSFEALSEYDAKDRSSVYFCDTQRDSKEYWSIRRNRIVKVAQADPATYRLIGSDFARDKAHVFYGGQLVPVKDAASFEVLEYGFTKDRIRAYHKLVEISGSDGATFVALNLHYAKDKSRVYFARLTETGVIKNADVESFKVLDDGYATDRLQAYHGGAVISRDNAASLEYLSMGYAKTARQVFYQGKLVPDADAPSFARVEKFNDAYDATDKSGAFSAGIRVPQFRAPIGSGG